MNVRIKMLRHDAVDPLPQYATAGAAAMDLHAALDEPTAIAAGAVAIVPTGIAVSIPPGYEIQVRSRSGLAAKNGIFALNSPGTIDSDYRGEISVILANFSKQDFTVKNGDRIAQIVLNKVERIEWSVVYQLDDTERGDGGFGSTGV